ncbi:Probable fatty acid desaturase [Mycobacteroides abscessus subsp. abscessus]|nr:Probable fatty acid desaturase [Mycobacteroides abscessus subsp. abscessus]
MTASVDLPEARSRELRIGSLALPSPVVLAPMAGVTNVAFRTLCRELELATRVSHRNTGKACAEPVADELLKRISTDENLHMIFYRNLVEAGMHIAPDQALKSIHKVLDNFKMPGYTIPGFRRNAVTIATGGVYDPQSHLDEVVMPVLRKWRIFERDDISSEGEWYREDLDRIIGDLKKTSADFEEVKAKYLERQAKRAERQAAKAAREAVSV